MRHRLPPLPCLILLLGLSWSSLPAKPALAQTPPTNVTYAANQPPRVWNTRPGALEFEGRALRREGDYVAFETTRKLHIWLPLRYLSEQSQTYLNALGAASSPLALDVTRPQVDTGPGGFGAPTEMINPNPSAANAKPSETTPPSATPPADDAAPVAAMPIDEAPAEEAKPQTFRSGQRVEVRANGQWLQGTIAAENPAQQKYFVSYRENNAPRSGWFEVGDLRAVEEEADEAEPDATTEED